MKDQYGANCALHPGAMFKPSQGCPTCEIGGAPYVLDDRGFIPEARTSKDVPRFTDGGSDGWMQSPTGEFVRYDDIKHLLHPETSDEPSVMGAGCGIAPMPTPSEGIEAAVRLIQKICAEYNLDPAQWLHGEKIEALITERDEAVALAAMWHESCTGKHGSQAPCVSPVKTSTEPQT